VKRKRKRKKKEKFNINGAARTKLVAGSLNFNKYEVILELINLGEKKQ